MTDKIKNSKENYLLVYPKQVSEDIGRAVNTMGFIDMELPDENLDTINAKLSSIGKELDNLEKDIKDFKDNNEETFESLPSTVEYYEKSENIISKMAKGEKYLYLTGWVPNSIGVGIFEAFFGEFQNSRFDYSILLIFILFFSWIEIFLVIINHFID